MSDNSKCIRASKGDRGLTSYFFCGGGMDVFCNDLLHIGVKIRLLSSSGENNILRTSTASE